MSSSKRPKKSSAFAIESDTNSSMNQSEFKVNKRKQSNKRGSASIKTRLVLDLLLIGWESRPLDPAKQDGVVNKIPCECSKVYMGETGRSMHERIKEHDI